MPLRTLTLILFFSSGLTGLGQQSFEDSRDSLSHIIRYSKNDTLKARAFIDLGRLYHGNRPGRAIYFYERAKDVSEVALLGNLTDEHRLSYLKILSGSMRYLSDIYHNQGEVKKELDYSFGALRINRYIGDELRIANSFYNLSTTFLSLGDTGRSLDYLKDALLYFRETKDQKGVSQSFLRLADIQLALGDTATALRYYNQSLEFANAIGDDLGRASCLNELSTYYGDIGELKKAFKTGREALRLSQSINNSGEIVRALYNLGSIEIERNNLIAAHRYVKRGLEIAEAIDFLAEEGEGNQLMSTIYERQGKLRQAFLHYEKYARIRQETLKNEARNRAIKQGVREEFQRKQELDRIDYRKSIRLKQQQRENQQIFAWFAGGVLVLLLILLVWSYSRYNIIKRQKRLIDRLNKKVVESITYAREIQEAILPRSIRLKKYFPNVFLLYEPMQIVSGDFLWFKPFKNHSVIVCVDSRGQGVAGGFMSTVGSLLLDRIVESKSDDPAQIVAAFRKEFNDLLFQEEQQLDTSMDVSVCIVHHQDRVVDFAGIRNGITIISDGKGIHYPSLGKDEMLLTGKSEIKQKRIELGAADWFFIYTDGFMEQRGGKQNKKLGYKRFEKMLKKSIDTERNEQKVIRLLSELTEWQDESNRGDDLLLIGFQI